MEIALYGFYSLVDAQQKPHLFAVLNRWIKFYTFTFHVVISTLAGRHKQAVSNTFLLYLTIYKNGIKSATITNDKQHITLTLIGQKSNALEA